MKPRGKRKGQDRQMSKTWQAKAREAMRALGINQNDIADRLGVSKGTVSNWFSGRHPASLADLRDIADMLGISISDMLSEDDCLARTALELETLRTLRQVPKDKEDQAAALIRAVLETLTPKTPPEN